MKPFYLLLLVVLISTAAFSQQLPSQVQAKRGVFTERLFLRDKWVDRISTDLNTDDSTSDNVLSTGKAIADFIRLHTNLTYTNGVTRTDNTISLGGTITQPITISGNTSANNITINGFTGLSNTATLNVKTVGSLGIGIQGEGPYYGVYGKSDNYGVYAFGTRAAGILAQSSTNDAGVFKTTSGRAIYGTVQPAGNNYIIPVLALDRNSTNPGANGIGLSIDLNNKTSTNAMSLSNQLFSKWRDANFDTRTSVFGITGTSNAVTDTLFELDGTGKIRLKNYTANGAFTSADTTSFKPAAFDAQGNLYRMQGWPASSGGGSTPLYFVQTSTVSVSGTSDETTLIGTGDGSLTIPASAWRPGKTYRVTISGRYTTDVNNPTGLHFNLKLGSVTIASKNSFVGANRNEQFRIVCEFTCRATGSSGAIITFGNMWNADNVNDFSNGTTASVIDLTTAQTINVTTQLSDTSAGNSVSSYIVTLEEIN